MPILRDESAYGMKGDCEFCYKRENCKEWCKNHGKLIQMLAIPEAIKILRQRQKQ